jgi:hypothetical protein
MKHSFASLAFAAIVATARSGMAFAQIVPEKFVVSGEQARFVQTRCVIRSVRAVTILPEWCLECSVPAARPSCLASSLPYAAHAKAMT